MAESKREERLNRARRLVSCGHFKSNDDGPITSADEVSKSRVLPSRGGRGRGRGRAPFGRSQTGRSRLPVLEAQQKIWQPKSAKALDVVSATLASHSKEVDAQPTLSGEDNVERPTLPIHMIHVYDTLGELGKGQFGVVSQAVRRKGSSTTGKVVAIKLLKFDFDREGFPLEALREITLLSSLRHPNIVRMHAVACSSDQEPPEWHLVMEPAGHELTTLVKGARRRPMTEAQVKNLMLQLLRALAALHSVWVMHRDLKTPNVLVDDKGVLRLCDFGLARRVCCGLELELVGKVQSAETNTDTFEISHHNFFVADTQGAKRLRCEGAREEIVKPVTHRKPNESYTTHTPNVISGHYRPPEVLLGCRDYGRPIDLWSAGCIFAELLSRQILFPGKDEPDQLRIIFDLLGEPSSKEWPLYARVVRV